MKKVFIVHGFCGIPNGGWFPWLMKELAKQNVFACSLPMPNANDSDVSEWIKTIKNCVGRPSDEILLLGHSLGVLAILRYLESLSSQDSIGGVLLVSCFIGSLDTENPRSEFRMIDSFVVPPINFERIRNIPKQSFVLHGSNDPIVPFTHAEKISKGMRCKLIKIEGGDHFSQRTEPVCYELPEALKILEQMIK